MDPLDQDGLRAVGLLNKENGEGEGEEKKVRENGEGVRGKGRVRGKDREQGKERPATFAPFGAASHGRRLRGYRPLKIIRWGWRCFIPRNRKCHCKLLQ